MEGFLKEVTLELPDEREVRREVWGRGQSVGGVIVGVLRWWQGLTRARWLHSGGWLRERVAYDEGRGPLGQTVQGLAGHGEESGR